MLNIKELLHTSQILGIPASVMDGEAAGFIIHHTIQTFSPIQTNGHLSIANHPDKVIKIALEDNEFTYSQKLPPSKGYVFFGTDSPDRNKIFVLNNVRDLCDITAECFGMEYFLVDEYFSYLIAVNWYVIEGSGLAMQYLANTDSVDVPK